MVVKVDEEEEEEGRVMGEAMEVVTALLRVEEEVLVMALIMVVVKDEDAWRTQRPCYICYISDIRLRVHVYLRSALRHPRRTDD